jgi:hypothetical protein|tara:strand:+ start:2649 stop:2828 length:180 start_codon:yes stop_codon:yes gene_type:complete
MDRDKINIKLLDELKKQKNLSEEEEEALVEVILYLRKQSDQKDIVSKESIQMLQLYLNQ